VRRFVPACISAILTTVSSNSQSLGGLPQPDDQPTTFISTFTVPTEVLHTLTREARVGDVAWSETAAGRALDRTVEFAV
jgi:hypothetical protein